MSLSLSLLISLSLSLNLSISPSFSLSPPLSLSLWTSAFSSETWMNTSSSGIAQDCTLPNLILLSLCLYLSPVLCVFLSLCQSIEEHAKPLFNGKIKLPFYSLIDSLLSQTCEYSQPRSVYHKMEQMCLQFMCLENPKFS